MAGTLFLGTIALTACASVAGSGGDMASPAASTASAADAQAGTGPRDLSQGGRCEDGENITIQADDATPVIEGNCGTVTVEANNVSGNIAAATTVTIRGTDSMLLGEKWGTATITGRGSGVNVDEIATLTVTADDAKVTNRRTQTATIDGSRATVNTDSIDRLTIDGSGSTVIASGAITALEVHGNDNTITWSDGAQAPTADTGTGNRYTR
ncbi:DUF3060 domain-containing protein [Micromonospora sp. NPDC047730]|uniref:DUF3060 domain-containing protein n=1 Tax=unclassified Micromonospora TaxID=2617518 RepID=UPI0037220ABA